jgi:hypothetical protein
MLLILTVGTGTAVKSADIATGLQNTIKLLKPRGFWLVPSLDENSVLVAELVRQGLENFRPLSLEKPFCQLTQHDNLEQCRLEFRNLLEQVKPQLQEGEKLLINATSGTKQMVIAAVIAALDEGCADINFTVGTREGGVVIAGTEQITNFDASTYFRQHDYRLATELFKTGAFLAAATVLDKHKTNLPKAFAQCQLLHQWRSCDYIATVSTAQTHFPEHRAFFAKRVQQAKEGRPSLALLSDILLWAEHARQTKDAATCMMTAHKALEMAARCALKEDLGLDCSRDGRYYKQHLLACVKRLDLRNKIEQKYRTEDTVALPLPMITSILEDCGSAFGKAYEAHPTLPKLSRSRNLMVHAMEPHDLEEAKRLLKIISLLVSENLPATPRDQDRGLLENLPEA